MTCTHWLFVLAFAPLIAAQIPAGHRSLGEIRLLRASLTRLRAATRVGRKPRE